MVVVGDRLWGLNASRNEGLIEGEIKTIRVLQVILQIPLSTESDFEGKSLEDLQSLTTETTPCILLKPFDSIAWTSCHGNTAY